MTSKRSHIEIDPDYEDVTEVQCKRRRVLEEGAKETTKRKIESIIRKQFEIEVSNKESELLNISEKLEIARNMIDRLRACIVANFYGQASQQKATKLTSNQAPMIHPTVRKFIGKAPPGTALLKESDIKQEPKVPLKTKDKTATLSEKVSMSVIKENANEIKPSSTLTQVDQSETRTGRFKVKKTIIVGNVSKSIPADQRDENDQATHKWMVYVRGSKECPHIHDFVKKVWFFLHPSYMPNDLVEVSQPPFHLTRRGWGEFPVRIQLHFKDPRNKRLDIIHNLKLDRTYTGLQTLGAETVVNVEIERDMPVVKSHKKLGKVDIKQEAMDTEQTIAAANLPNHVDLRQMKTEPPEDHGYGKGIFTVECPDDHDYGIGTCSMESVTSSMQIASKCQNVTLNTQPHDIVPKLRLIDTLNTMGTLTVTSNSVGPVASSSLIASQPLALSSMVASLSQTVAPCTPTKDTFIQLSSISPTGKNIAKPSPLKNIVLKGLGAITSSSLTDKTNNVINVPNHLIQLSPMKGATKASVTLSIAQSNVFTNAAGNQPVKTGSPSLPQFNIRANVPVNQSSNSSLIFLKCTDSQGKTYLIPQQVSPSSNSMIKAADTNPLQVVSTISQPILVSQAQVTSSTGMRITTNVNTSQQKCIMKGQIVGNAGDSSPVRSPVQNGPVLFIKPANSIIMNKKTTPGGTKTVNMSLNANPVRVNSAPSLHLVKNFSPKQGINIVNFKAASPSGIIGGNQSLLRGQLKVTPQGLIHVRGQQPSSASIQNQIEQKVLVNGDIAQNSFVISAQSKQPLSLLSTSVNNKLTILQSKGKSLLNPPVANMPRSQSNGNVIFLNQSNEMASAANVGQLVLTTGIKTESDPTKIIDAATVLVQNKAAEHSTPNQMVFVPLTSKENVPSTISGIVCATSQSQNSRTLLGAKNLPSGVNSFHLGKTSIEAKANDKTMFILVKNDTTKTNSVNTHGQKPLSSLLGQKAALPFVPMATKARETAITVSSSLNKEKQIIVVNGDCIENDLMNAKSLLTKEKKIMLDPKRNKSLKHTDMKEKEAICSLCISDYPDMVSLIQAAVKRHPVVSESCGRQLHPYCAKTSEEWLSWNLGKRRASEWQRASSVRKFILPYLDDDKCYKGESVWTIKKILTWCRLHIYSPHYLERPLHPAGIDFQIDISLPADKNNKKFTSITNSTQIIQEVTSLQENVTLLESSDDEVDIVSIDIKKNKIKKDLERKLQCKSVELMEGTPFIESSLHKIGIHLTPTEVEPDFYATVSQGILYRAMEQFMGDILRETFAHQVNMGRYPDSLGVADVYAALNSLSITDFLTNKYMGVEESQGIPTVQR